MRKVFFVLGAKRSSTTLGLTIARLGLIIVTLGLKPGYSQTAAQRKMIGDDKQAVYKGDTSIVVIGDTTYQKVIGVSYKMISEQILKAEYLAKAETVKRQMEQERETRERSNAELERLRAELDREKAFYEAAAKQLKFKSRKAIEPDTSAELIRATAEARQAAMEIRDNPRKP